MFMSNHSIFVFLNMSIAPQVSLPLFSPSSISAQNFHLITGIKTSYSYFKIKKCYIFLPLIIKITHQK